MSCSIPDKDLQKVLRDHSNREIAMLTKGVEEKVKLRILASLSERRRELIRLESDALGAVRKRRRSRASRISLNMSSSWSRKARSRSCASGKSLFDPDN